MLLTFSLTIFEICAFFGVYVYLASSLSFKNCYIGIGCALFIMIGLITVGLIIAYLIRKIRNSYALKSYIGNTRDAKIQKKLKYKD